MLFQSKLVTILERSLERHQERILFLEDEIRFLRSLVQDRSVGSIKESSNSDNTESKFVPLIEGKTNWRDLQQLLTKREAEKSRARTTQVIESIAELESEVL